MGESTTVLVCFGIVLGLAGCGEARDQDRPETSAGQGGNGAGGMGPTGEGGNGAGGMGSTASRVVLGCQDEPLTLGPASNNNRVPQMVWTGSDFAAGWVMPDGYQIRITTGASTSNTLKLSEMPEAAEPQLFWTGSELELYYALEDSIYVDRVTDDEGPLAVVETKLVGSGGEFRAVMTDPSNVAVVTNTTLFLDGNTVQTRIYGIGEIGWNGQYFLHSSVLGHGEWNLNRLDADGSTAQSPIELRWTGIHGTGRGAGSYFASSAATGRHAIAIAASGELTFAVEGFPTFERAMLKEDADVSVFWNGEYYLVLFANGPEADGARQRDIALLAFTKEGVPVSDMAVPISEHAADERFPVGVAADKSTFGVAWIQGDQLVIQRCSVVFR